MRRSAVGKYQKMCHKNNISRHAKICSGQISDVLRRLFCKYQQICEDLWANIRSWANIRRRGKICGNISADVRKSVGKLQQTCEDLWLNISSCAKLRGQITADAQRFALGKYQKTFEDLWANISRHVKISWHIVVWAQNNITTLCSIK